MGDSDATKLRFSRDTRAAHITLDRPNHLNAINDAMVDSLQANIEDINSQEPVRIVTIRGAGEHFSAGADLESLYTAIQHDDRTHVKTFLERLHSTLNALSQLPVPTVALVDGYALAGGLETLLACDWAVATDEAVIGDQHATYGLVGGGGGTQRLHRAVGPRRAKELIFTGRQLTASEAEQWGLVTRTVPSDQFDEYIDDTVDELASKGRQAAVTAKTLIETASESDLETGLRLERTMVTDHMFSSDAREGLAAFDADRDPDFS